MTKKVNTHLLNLIQQILAAKVLGQAAEEARLISHGISDIVNRKYSHLPANDARSRAEHELTTILDVFILEK